ncbi:hypothetical protein A2690_03655 [Candidatus Roizmanbacteria bacterium RIFCSPHIGHO2_01_FULL_39_12b]|uniref:Uncharacterized protein n=1 Tax=Candidatus Roizmanbacteria bacterium RIFCSPHIGHO2_01_FULL_39_12b TaxID=1802030 RepID=A0A1F7GD85_9BACT|nr:MAG: hypothetical protein A2690_03655 [Candidatus Roizmanbacteria bacterium RIFCSPHIGHO2_01_FULL_39_12b]
MTSIRHVNLLDNKESGEKRKKITKLFRYTAVGLVLLTFFLAGFASLASYSKKNALASLTTEKNTLKSQLDLRQEEVRLATIINSKSTVIKAGSVEEADFADFYQKGLEFLPVEIVQTSLSHIILDKFGSGIYKLKFNNFENLNQFIKDIETAKKTNKFKAYRIERVSINEGTPSSSMVDLKLQFK